MDLIVTPDTDQPTRGRVTCGDVVFACALGRTGVGRDKTEGDGKTPIGHFALRKIFYRADRVDLPKTDLPTDALTKSDGWCDAPDDPAYNTFVTHPYPSSAEYLWREDHRYNLIVVLGYNDDPVVPGTGSAIFMHVAAPGFTPTEGCVALRQEDLLTVLTECTPASTVIIQAPQS